jgi:hypothetical protein
MPQLTEIELLDHIDPSQLDYQGWVIMERRRTK